MGNLTRLDYHFVFVTRYRKKVLLGLESDVERAFRAAAVGGNFEVIEFACDLGDHVHVVLRLSPNVSVSQVVRRLKQLTTLDLWSRHEVAFRKKYWKKNRVLWSSGYYASTIGEVSRDTALEYVRKQS